MARTENRPRPAATAATVVAAGFGWALLAGLAAGCAQGAGGAASGPSDAAGAADAAGQGWSGGASPQAPADDAVRRATFNSDVPPGMPLEPYYAALRHEASLLRPGIEQAEAQRTADMEDEVARCMSAAGFTYYPVETSEPALDESARALLEKEVGWLWDRLPVPQLGDTREDVAKHGYGQWEAFDLGLSGARLDDGAIALGEPGPDPNAEYTATLSEAAFNAYLKALEGVEPAGDGTWTGDGLAFSGEGDSCRAQAARKFPDPVLERPLSDYVYQDLVGGMAEISWQVDDDPSTLALDREWAACMLERGFDASEERGTGDGGVERISAGPVQAFQLAMRTGADGRVAAEYGDPDAPEDQRSLIQSGPEIEIALADFDCRVETDYMNRLIAIQTAMETAFVEENRSALDELLAAIEANIAVG